MTKKDGVGLSNSVPYKHMETITHKLNYIASFLSVVVLNFSSNSNESHYYCKLYKLCESQTANKEKFYKVI